MSGALVGVEDYCIAMARKTNATLIGVTDGKITDLDFKKGSKVAGQSSVDYRC